MRKRITAIITIIIFILSAAAAVISAVTGSTAAWFTSSLSSKGNVFKSGTVAIKYNESVSAGIADIGNAYPGWKGISIMRIENTGSLDLEYRMYIDDAGLKGNPLFDGDYPVSIGISRGDSALKDYTAINNFGAFNMGSIKKGGYDCFEVAMELPEDADNSCQGKSMDLSFIFEAKQEGSGSAYPGEVLVKSIKITSDDGSFSVSPGKPLKLSAHVEPENASCRDVTWSVIPDGGNALVDRYGLVQAVSNGSIRVRASAMDSSGIFQESAVDVGGVTVINGLDKLKAAMQDSSIKTIDVAPTVYNIKGGVLRDSSAGDAVITCSGGEAIVNIIKGNDSAYGLLPGNIKSGAGVTINEGVILANPSEHLQTTIDNAPANSIIAFNTCILKDSAIINKPLTLLGIQSCLRGYKYSGDSISLRDAYGSNIGGLTVTGEGLTNTVIRGFNFINDSGVSIAVDGSCSNIKIVNNMINKDSDGGIRLNGENCRGITVQGNGIGGWKNDNTAGIGIEGNRNADIAINGNYIIESNHLVKYPTGISVRGGNNIRINNNTIGSSCRTGIYISGAGDAIECRGNTINNTIYGIMFKYGALPGMSNISICGNNILQAYNSGIAFVAESSTAQGCIKGLNICGNTINRDIHWPANEGIYSSISISLCQGALQHGTVNILNNNLKIYGTGSCADGTCCLQLMGKLNVVNIYGNVFTDESDCSVPQYISGIHIVKDDAAYGPIPKDAAITGSLTDSNGFDVFHGIKIKDER